MAIAKDPREEHGENGRPSEEEILVAWLLPGQRFHDGYHGQPLHEEGLKRFQEVVSPELKLGFYIDGSLSILEGWNKKIAEIFGGKLHIPDVVGHVEEMSTRRQYLIGKASHRNNTLPYLDVDGPPALAVRNKANLPQDYEAMLCMGDEMVGRYAAVVSGSSLLVGISKVPFIVGRDSRLSFRYK